MGYRVRVRRLALPKLLKYLAAYQPHEENHEIIRPYFGSAHLYKCTIQLFKWLDGWCNPGSIIGSSTRMVRQAGLFLTEHKNLLEITKILVYWYRIARATETESFIPSFKVALNSCFLHPSWYIPLKKRI
jgi:hypothetical protein